MGLVKQRDEALEIWSETDHSRRSEDHNANENDVYKSRPENYFLGSPASAYASDASNSNVVINRFGISKPKKGNKDDHRAPQSANLR